MNKGFTLMEMLAVVLVVTLMMSFALPVYRSVRFEMRHSQAQEAALKMADAMRTYYTRTKGGTIINSLDPTSDEGKTAMASTDCTNLLATGIPNNGVDIPSDIAQLFACGYLSYKDFRELPYVFTAQGRADPLVVVTGLDRAGQYKDKSFSVSKKMIVVEEEED